MAEARGRDNWQHTSALLALLANIHRDPKRSGPFKPDDFNPYAQRKGAAKVDRKTGFAALRELFVKERNRGGR